jgi:hypothetical protein
MTKILDRLPILGTRTSVRFGDRHVTVLADQMLVWVSINLAGMPQPEKTTPRIPALLDPGNNFGFAIRYRHLREWAGMDPGSLGLLGTVEIDGQSVQRREASVWIYPNVPGAREVAEGKQPHLLELKRGIAIYPRDAEPPGPRLPLVGLPALVSNDLDCWIDPETRQITVQTRTWRRRLVRLLCGV